MTGAVGAVVVNYNARDHLLECVRSLRAEGVDDVVVVDNDSRDGSGEALAASDPAARLVATSANLGYGRAANRGALVARGDHLLVCNSDVVLEPGAVKALVAALEGDDRLALVGPRVENLDGTLYPSPRTFPDLGVALGHAFLGLVAPGNRFTRRYRMLDWDHSGAAHVDWVSGACFVARREAWQVLGGFDEAYFMYAEDVDLCWRARQAGWKVAFEPAAGVVHVQGVSSDLAPYRMIVEHHRSLLRFYRRSTAGGRAVLVPLVAAGLAARAVLACAQRALVAAKAG
ncbi:MAG: glycosyltransferase family 2 protein [Actinomycetota bacterium]|nr:glycosyltransferase family 2 protein [Actinomycetota bacterium]